MRSHLFAPLVLALALAFAPACAATPTLATSSSDLVTSSHALEAFTSDDAGFDTHSFWLDTGKEVVVFDAQFTPAYADQLISEIQAKTPRPIRWVVVTHPNPDKFNGAPAFQRIGAKVVASESTAAAIPSVHAYKKAYFVDVAHSFTAESYPAQASIDVTFRGDWDLPLEGEASVHLHELAHRGVSSTQTVAFLPEQQALVVGDLVHVRAHAWLEGGIVDGKPVPDLTSWASALEELRAYSGATVYGGRGDTAPVLPAVDAEEEYLRRVGSIVRTYVAGLGPAKAELFGPPGEMDAHAKKIEALAEEAFPDYSLGFMIEYGVYGLAQQVAGS